MAQRRQVRDTGFWPNFLTGAVGEVQRRQQRKEKLNDAIAEAMAIAKAKADYDPEVQAKNRILALSREDAQPQYGRDVIGPPTMQAADQGARREREMKWLQYLVPQRPPGLAETIAMMQTLNQPGGTAPSPNPAPASPVSPPPKPPQQFPGRIPLERAGRAVSRAIGIRETPKALMESYSAKTAAAAKGFGDTANIAVEERKMVTTSFPRDGESAEARQARKQSLDDFFTQKIELMQQTLHQPTPQILKGYSRSGPRYEVDSSIVAAKRQAAQDLSRLKQTQVLYDQMYAEADRLMPAIGTEMSSEPNFSSEEEAEAANLPSGTRIRINGNPAIWE